MATTVTFDIPKFRLMFPEFANSVTFPDPRLQLYWDAATQYFNTTVSTNFQALNVTQLTLALNLLTAHLARLFTQLHPAVGLLTGSTIDKISVQLKVPEYLNAWRWWLLQTPYGAELLALLETIAAGGFYFGGASTRGTLRR